MTNVDFIDEIKKGMYQILTGQQMDALEHCLLSSLKGKSIAEEETSLAICPQQLNEIIMAKYKEYLEYKQYSKTTIKHYIHYACDLLIWTNKAYNEVVSDDCLLYLNSIKARGCSGTHIDNCRKFCKRFFTWCLKYEYIKKNPFDAVENVKRNPIQKKTFNDIDIATMRDKANDSVRDRAILDFLNSTGVRVGEMVTVKWKDVDFKTNTVSIFAHKTNTFRTVPMDAECVKHLLDYKKYLADKGIESEYVWINDRKYNGAYSPMSANRVEYVVAKYCGDGNTVHKFRKTLGTKLAKKGMPLQMVSKVLGHTNIATTEKYYADTDESTVIEKYRTIVS